MLYSYIHTRLRIEFTEVTCILLRVHFFARHHHSIELPRLSHTSYLTSRTETRDEYRCGQLDGGVLSKGYACMDGPRTRLLGNG